MISRAVRAQILAKVRQALGVVAVTGLFAGAMGWAHSVHAADGGGYPNRPIRVIVPFGAGSQIDIVAHPSLDVSTLPELIALARRQPGRIAYATAGIGSVQHLVAWPDIPTVVELGFREAAADPWNGVLAPAGTPPEIIDLLYRELARIVQQPDVRDRFAQMGMELLATSPAQFGAEIREAVARWPAIVKAAGIRRD